MLTFSEFIVERRMTYRPGSSGSGGSSAASDRSNCDLITFADIQELERMFDRKFSEFDIDFKFTRHFSDRASDERNKPCITLDELTALFNRLYLSRKQGRKIFSRWPDMEIVLNDVKNNLNIPFAIEYDKRKDEFDVIAKTIMRKKNFKTSGPVVKV